MSHYEVQHFTICDGWTNTWQVDDKPQTFTTMSSARMELKEFFAEMDEAFEAGDVSAPEDPSQYRVVHVDDCGDEKVVYEP